MTNVNQGYPRFVLLFSGLVLGLGWAIRGVFGHEWGASWAGSLGVLAVIVAINRNDWLRRAPILAALGGVGWGVGGMMSYGLMVASGRGVEFPSVAYGYAMLLVIGGLYGFIGGGLLGLGLESGDKKTAWHALITEMVVFSYLAYATLVGVAGWRMTPPRGDSWAYCLGAAIALAWFLHRGGFHRALRVAVYAALGAGLGFSFGNLIQTLSLAAGLPVNAWNIMEFLLGFGGGAGMAYAVLTRDWPEAPAPSPALFWGATVFLVTVLPGVNRAAAFSFEHFTSAAERLGRADATAFASTQLTTATAVWAIMAAVTLLFAWRTFNRPGVRWDLAGAGLLFLHALHFALLGAVKTSILYTPFSLWNTRLWYLPGLACIALYWLARGRKNYALPALAPTQELPRRWVIVCGALVLLPLLFALIAIMSHAEPIEPYYERFGAPRDI